MAELENIDDECDQNDIAFVKIDDDKEAKEYGIETIPTMVLFEKGIPHIYEGDLMKEDDLLGWLLHQKRHSEIPEVTDEMMDKLIETTPYLAVIFCEYLYFFFLLYNNSIGTLYFNDLSNYKIVININRWQRG